MTLSKKERIDEILALGVRDQIAFVSKYPYYHNRQTMLDYTEWLNNKGPLSVAQTLTLEQAVEITVDHLMRAESGEKDAAGHPRVKFNEPIFYDGSPAKYVGPDQRPGMHMIKTLNAAKPKVIFCDQWGNVDGAVKSKRARRVVNAPAPTVSAKSDVLERLEKLEARMAIVERHVPHYDSRADKPAGLNKLNLASNEAHQ